MDVREKKQRIDPKINPKLKKNSESKTYRSNHAAFGSSHKNESDLDHRKNHGPLRKNIAQSRLDRLRATFNVKSGFVDKIGKFQSEEGGHRLRKSDVICDKFIPHAILKSTKYSADARIRKIRQESLKLLAKKKSDELLNDAVSKTFNESVTSSKYQASTVPEQFPEPQITIKPKIESLIEPKVQRIISTKVESGIGDDLMDVDIDLPEMKATSCRNSLVNRIEENWIDDNESNVQFINDEISKLRNDSSYLASHENLVQDVVMNLDIPSGDVLIMVDTNIFLSHLHFLNKLLKCDLPPYQRPIVVVPWPVIQEIDHIMKKDNERLSSSARVANHFIYDCLKKKHPRFFGQSLDDFKVNFQNAVNIDDFILQYCMKFASMENNVILVTNDINLCNKSMINHLKVFTKQDFEKSFNISVT